MSEEFKKVHPLLNEVTNTFIELHENKKEDETLRKLLELEKLLHENLEKIRQAKD